MPNFRVGLTMMACLPAFLALSTLELLAGRVVPNPFDGSAVVEGTVRPTTASSPDVVVWGILVAGLESNFFFQNQTKQNDKWGKVLDKLLTCCS